MSSSGTILITGANGHIGRAIARHLELRDATLRLMARDPGKLAGFASAQKVQGDYADVASLDRACAGVETAFIVSGYAAPGERAQLHRNAFEAARRAGVSYVVYLSFLGASQHSLFPMSRDHFESELYLKQTGIPHTVLQDSFYTELALDMFGKDGVLKAPAGLGKVSWVGREEAAEAVATLLAAEQPVLGTFPLTGPSALSLTETASALTGIIGRSFLYEEETLERAFAKRRGFGAPDWEVSTWVGSYQAIAAGEVAAVDASLPRSSRQACQRLHDIPRSPSQTLEVTTAPQEIHMKYLSTQLLLALLIAAFACTLPTHKALAQADEESSSTAQLRALQRQYVASIDQADTTIVNRIWSHDPEVIFIEPRGTEHGIDQVKLLVSDTFEKIFSKRDLILETPAIHVYGDTAWSDMTWTFHATVRGYNAPITTQGRERQIYRKEIGAWHIIAVHYSGPPITGALKGF